MDREDVIYLYTYIIYIHTHIYVHTHTHTHIYNGIMLSQKTEIMPLPTAWMDLEIIILSEVSHTEKNII